MSKTVWQDYVSVTSTITIFSSDHARFSGWWSWCTSQSSNSDWLWTVSTFIPQAFCYSYTENMWKDQLQSVHIHLHDGVVEGDEGGEKVQVACGEHQGKENLTLPRYPWKTNNNMHAFQHSLVSLTPGSLLWHTKACMNSQNNVTLTVHEDEYYSNEILLPRHRSEAQNEWMKSEIICSLITDCEKLQSLERWVCSNHQIQLDLKPN